MIRHRYSHFLSLTHFVGDVLLLNLAFALAYHFKFAGLVGLYEKHYLWLVIAFNVGWLVSAFVFELYELSRVADYTRTAASLARALLLHVLLVFAFIVVRKAYYYSREQLLFTYLLLSLLLVVWRTGLVFALRQYRKLGFNFRRVIVVGNGKLGAGMQEFFQQRREYGYRFMGIFDDNSEKGQGVIGRVEDVKDYALTNKIDEVYCSLPDTTNDQVNDLIEFADKHLIKVKILPDFRGFALKSLHVDFYDSLPVFSIRTHPLDDALNRSFKRVFDVLFSLVFVVFISSWLFPLIALLVKLSSPGPIFFRQRRSGRDNQAFWCLKFRTMRVNDESDLRQASHRDERITAIGRLLRKTSLDELPQFFNVLVGEMSVVGPRPHMLKHTQEYERVIDDYMVRHLVKPGITGLAQAKGYRGETPTIQYMRNRVKMDRFYIDNWSMLLDLKIIGLTMSSMLRGNQNAY